MPVRLYLLKQIANELLAGMMHNDKDMEWHLHEYYTWYKEENF